MGQKVNPIGMRLNINKSWDSNWFAGPHEYADKLNEDLKIRNFIYDRFLGNKAYARVEISNVKISRVGDVVNVIIYNTRPGLLIGKKGQDIEKLKSDLVSLLKIKTKLNISMNELKDMESNAFVVAQQIGKSIENRIPYKRAVKQAMMKVMKSGEKGIKVRISGRLNGADMSRQETFREGSVPLHTFDAIIDYHHYHALTTYGIIGVSVWVHKGKMSKESFNRQKEETYAKG